MVSRSMERGVVVDVVGVVEEVDGVVDVVDVVVVDVPKVVVLLSTGTQSPPDQPLITETCTGG